MTRPKSRRYQPNQRGRLRRLALFWLTGIAVILVTVVVAALLNQAGYFLVAMTCACLCALTLIPFGMLAARSGESEDDWGVIFTIALCGTLITFAASVVGQDDVVLFGGSARDVVAAQAPETGAAFFHFRDTRVLTDRIIRVPVYATGSLKQKSHIAYYAAFAPIVDRDWTPEQTVAAFAFIGSPTLGHRTAEWRQPWNAGILTNAVNADERDIALGKFRARDGLNVSAKAVVLRWSADPEGEAAAARGRLVTAVLIATTLWSLAIAIGLVVVVRRRRRSASDLRHF